MSTIVICVDQGLCGLSPNTVLIKRAHFLSFNNQRELCTCKIVKRTSKACSTELGTHQPNLIKGMEGKSGMVVREQKKQQQKNVVLQGFVICELGG